MSKGEIAKDFEKLRVFLSQVGMSESQIKTYLMGIEKGIITSRDVASSLDMNRSTASEHLKKMAMDDFFEETLHDGKRGTGGTGRGIKYKVILPSTRFSAILGLMPHIDRIEQRSENLSTNYIEEGFWKINKQNTAMVNIKETIKKAKHSLILCSNDGSWVRDQQLLQLLNESKKRGVIVDIRTGQLEKALTQILKSNELSVEKNEDLTIPPFLISDNSVLFLSYATGDITVNYGVLKITNKYLIDKFYELFYSLKKGGDRNE